MLDIKTYLKYDAAEKIERMKLIKFASENNYFFYYRDFLCNDSVTFVFMEQFPISYLEIVVKTNEDLYFRLLSENKLAEYVIEEVKKNKKHEAYKICKKKLGIKKFF